MTQLSILATGQILENCDLQGPLRLRSLFDRDDVRVPVLIRDSVLGSSEAAGRQFHLPVVLEHARVVGVAEF